jgi:hypothetical protein
VLLPNTAIRKGLGRALGEQWVMLEKPPIRIIQLVKLGGSHYHRFTE